MVKTIWVIEINDGSFKLSNSEHLVYQIEAVINTCLQTSRSKAYLLAKAGYKAKTVYNVLEKTSKKISLNA